MIELHLKKLRARDDIGADEEQAIRAAIAEVREHPAGKIFIERDKELDQSSLILEGLACRFKDLRKGERQITELHVAGDLADLHSFTAQAPRS